MARGNASSSPRNRFAGARRLKRTGSLIALLLIPIGLATASSADSYLQFERMWPTLLEPWYFSLPQGMATDEEGNVYVADAGNYRIVKMNRDGVFSTEWGSNGDGDGQFWNASGVARDRDGNLYVSDAGRDNIQIFTSNGVFVDKWDTPDQFDAPVSVAVDGAGDVYVADMYHDRIVKFTSDGTYVREWGAGMFSRPSGVAADGSGNFYVADTLNHRVQKFSAEGTLSWTIGGSGEFSSPSGVAVDHGGNVYVADRDHMRIRKYTSDGDHLVDWGGYGVGDGRFLWPAVVAVDNDGNVYVTESNGSRVQKFTSNGVFLARWGSSGGRGGEFLEPRDVAVDLDGNAYVVDSHNNRIQKFGGNGVFLLEWGSFGTADGEFGMPYGVGVDGTAYVYVADWGWDRIQKFTPEGAHVATWDGDRFNMPRDVAVDSVGNVYVADTGNNHIWKFNSDGVLQTDWGGLGSGDYQFNVPSQVAVAGSAYVYVADTGNHRIMKYTAAGGFKDKWDAYGIGDGELMLPSGVAVDGAGNVYVIHGWLHRIQKFTNTGDSLGMFGSFGTGAGNLSNASGLAAATVGGATYVYVADTNNNRIQVFKSVPALPSAKAIVVAAGGPFPGNNLWDTTQLCANFAYRTLNHQGFTKDHIFYLSSNRALDLDGNRKADDVDADATNENLQDAITSWATSGGTEDVVVYLVDHGGAGNFRMSGTETLDAAVLDTWLDTLEASISGTLTVVYDACESGTFQTVLVPTDGQQRIVVTSTSPGESAYFLSQGTVSFSVFFWTHVFNGATVLEAFDLATAGMEKTLVSQSPLLVDSPGNETLAAATYLGNGTQIVGDAPVIGDHSDPQSIWGTSTATIFADPVTNANGIARVWAVLQPPDYVPGSTTNPVQDLPNFDLLPVGGDRYEASYSGFNKTGRYQVAIYARDRIGNMSSPELTMVAVDSPLRRKAIIAVGGTGSHPQWDAFENAAGRAYAALKLQQYSDADIAFRSPVTFNAGVDGAPSLSSLAYLIKTWGTFDTYDLVLYLVGPASGGSFLLGTGEVVDAKTLDSWIDVLQTTIPGTVTVIIDCDYAGGYVPDLIPPAGRQRIVFTSTGSGQTARFGAGGDVSYSAYFWAQILNGVRVRNANKHARNAMYFNGGGQLAVLEDNANGVGNEKTDGVIAQNYAIGAGIQLAGDAPVIGSIVDPQEISGTSSATIWVDGVTSTGTIDSVVATIRPPGHADGDPLIELTLGFVSGNRYEATYTSFNSFGAYAIEVVARDSEGQTSAPASTTVTRTDLTDAYEPDNSSGAASFFDLDAGASQPHNFHVDGDEDWVRFFAQAGDPLAIETFDLGSNCDTLLTVYQGTNPTPVAVDLDLDPETYMEFTAADTDFYYVKAVFSPASPLPQHYGPDSGYTLRIFRPIGACLPAILFVDVRRGSENGPDVSGANLYLTKSGGVEGQPFAATNAQGEANTQVSVTGATEYTVRAELGAEQASTSVNMNCGKARSATIVLALDPGSGALIEVTPRSVDFGAIPWNTVSDEATFTLKNIGDAELAGSAMVSAGPFIVSSGASYNLPAGTTHQVKVRFDPPDTSAQHHTGQLTLSGGGTVTAALSGYAFNPATFKVGDVNTDGSIDALDATLISLYFQYGSVGPVNVLLSLVGLNAMTLALADIDRADSVTLNDASLLNLGILMGKTKLNEHLDAQNPKKPISHVGEPLE